MNCGTNWISMFHRVDFATGDAAIREYALIQHGLSGAKTVARRLCRKLPNLRMAKSKSTEPDDSVPLVFLMPGARSLMPALSAVEGALPTSVPRRWSGLPRPGFAPGPGRSGVGHPRPWQRGWRGLQWTSSRHPAGRLRFYGW
jgi:hypothetical protein